MYAVIQTGGKQVRVKLGDVGRVEHRPGEVGAPITFDKVLLVSDQDNRIKLGSPVLDGCKVSGTVVEQGRAKKILLYTYKRRQNSNRRRAGHRQNYTAVKIDSIDG
ncbi:50S ribosomal protein L21 [bacterium]|nr:MAG: 50S ribosomal protein L21 [bacterium]